MPDHITAHVDETSGPLPNGQRLYAIAAVLTTQARQAEISVALRAVLLPGRPYLHHYDETFKRRCLIAKTISELSLDGAIILTKITTNQAQERTRARVLTALLPRLQHTEHVFHVVVESRHRSDKHDVRTQERLRRSRSITTGLRIDHMAKQEDPLLWLPDFVAGAWLAAHHAGEPEPWKIIEGAHCIYVVSLNEEPDKTRSPESHDDAGGPGSLLAASADQPAHVTIPVHTGT